MQRLLHPESPAVAMPAPRQRGFSMIDLVGGVVLSVIALGGVITTTIAASKLRRVDQELVLAHQACRSKIEQISDLTSAQIAAQNGTTFIVDGDADGTNDLQPQPGSTQPGSVTVTTAETDGTNTLYRVTVLVRWTGAQGARSYSMLTFKTERRGS